MVPLRLEMGTDGGDGEARRALSDKLPRVLRGGGSKLQFPLFSHYLRVTVDKFR